MSRTFARLVPIALTACALSLPLVLAGCNQSGSSSEASPTEAAQTQESTSKENEAEGAAAETTAEEKPEDAEHTSPIPEQETDETYRAQWETKACSFLTVYPVNYVLAGSADEPMQMTLEDWASNCLSYLDPSCQLAQDLQSDPEAVAVPLGYYEAAQFVDSTKVSSSDDTSVTVTVTIKGTQHDWADALTLVRTFRVTFGDKALITGVEDLG